jgi:hypothetical protein
MELHFQNSEKICPRNWQIQKSSDSSACVNRSLIAPGGADLFILKAVTITVFGKGTHANMKLTMKGKGAALIQGAAAVAVASLLGSEVAMAGADTTFNTALTSFTGFLEGSGGKIITVLSLAGGIVGLASGRFSLGQVAIPVGVGVGAGTGVPIVTAAVTATI